MTPVRSRTIPQELHGPLLEWLRGAGPDGRVHTLHEAVAWMRDVHGIRTSRRAIARVTSGYSSQAKELYASILRDEIRDAVGPALDRVRAASRRLADALDGEEDVKAIATATRAQVAVLEALAKVSGVAAPVAVDLTSGGSAITLVWPDAKRADDHSPDAPPEAD